MKQLEPTYLRYVYDGLSKGSISSNNPTSLPIGFIGLFEDEFPSSMPLVERMSILNRLAIWALLKGPVSIEMVAEILNEHPDNTKALVDTYSKWFNSPEPGKYVLYHDRLRTYLLQKLSNHEVQDLNETLISYLENTLGREGLKEAESYALEYLSSHMAIESQMGNNYERLHEFVNQEDLWNRQISNSQEYKWSQKAIQFGIREGARRHDEKVCLNSSINKLYLKRQETENYDEIFNCIRNEEYDVALKRLNGIDNEFQYKLYVLVLFEVVMGSLSDFEIDINFTINVVSNLKIIKEKNNFRWREFFSEILMYVIHVKLNNREIDISFMWENEKIDFQKFINYDYRNLLDKEDWYSCLHQILGGPELKPPTSLNFSQKIKFNTTSDSTDIPKIKINTVDIRCIGKYDLNKINFKLEKFIEYNFIEYESEFNKHLLDNNLIKDLNELSLSDTLYEIVSSPPKDRGVVSEIYAFELSKILIELGFLSYVEIIIKKTESKIYKYYISMILIKSLILKGDFNKAIEIAAKFDSDYFKKNLLQICYVHFKEVRSDYKSIDIIDKLILLSYSNQSKQLFLNSIYTTLRYFNNTNDLEYFLQSTHKEDRIIFKSEHININKLNLFIIDDKIESTVNINIDELNKNINKLEIDQKIIEFDKELYQRPTDEVFIRGLEILIYYDKIGNYQKFNSFIDKLISFTFKENSGWYLYSQIIFDLLNNLIENQFTSFFNLEYLCKIGVLIEDNDLRSKIFLLIFKKFPVKFETFKEINELDLVIDFICNPKNGLTQKEIYSISLKFELLKQNHAIKLLTTLDLNLIQSKKILALTYHEDRQILSKIIFENEFLKRNKIHKDLILSLKSEEDTLIENKVEFISQNLDLVKNNLDNEKFELIREKLSQKNIFLGDVKINLISKLITNKHIDHYRDIISENFSLSDFNRALSKISIKLSKLKHFEKSIDVLKMIKNDEANWVLSDNGVDKPFNEELAQREIGSYNNNQELVLKTVTSQIISKELLKNNFLDRAINVANNIEILINRLYLYSDLINLSLNPSENQSEFNFENIKKLIINKSETYYYDFRKGPIEFNIILDEISHKLCNYILDINQKDKYHIIDKLFLDDNTNDIILNDIKNTNLNENGLEGDYFNKGINLSELALRFYELGNHEKARLYFNKSIAIYRLLKKYKSNQLKTLNLLTELSLKLFFCDKKLVSNLSIDLLKDTIEILLLIIDNENIIFLEKNYEDCSDMNYYISKKQAVNRISIELFNYFLTENDQNSFDNLFTKIYLSEENKNIESLNKLKSYKVERIKRYEEINSPDVVLNIEKKLHDEIIFEICTLKFNIIIKLNNHKSSKTLLNIVDSLNFEVTQIYSSKIESSVNLLLARLFLRLIKTDDLHYDNLLDVSMKLNFEDFIKLIDFSIEVLSTRKIMKLLIMKERVDDFGYKQLFFENYKFQIQKNIYPFLSNSSSNQIISQIYLSHSFKNYFKTKKNLSLFDKLFKTNFYQELNNLTKGV